MDFPGWSQNNGQPDRWYPRVYQNGAVAMDLSRTYGWYRTDGEWVQAWAQIVTAASGTGNNVLFILGFPLPTIPRRTAGLSNSGDSFNHIGNFKHFDTGTAYYVGSVQGDGGASTEELFTKGLGVLSLHAQGGTSAMGITTNFGIAAGDRLTINLHYPFLYADRASLRQDIG